MVCFRVPNVNVYQFNKKKTDIFRIHKRTISEWGNFNFPYDPHTRLKLALLLYIQKFPLPMSFSLQLLTYTDTNKEVSKSYLIWRSCMHSKNFRFLWLLKLTVHHFVFFFLLLLYWLNETTLRWNEIVLLLKITVNKMIWFNHGIIRPYYYNYY